MVYQLPKPSYFAKIQSYIINFGTVIQRNASKFIKPLTDLSKNNNYIKQNEQLNKIKAITKMTIGRRFRNGKLFGGVSYRRCTMNAMDESLNHALKKKLEEKKLQFPMISKPSKKYENMFKLEEKLKSLYASPQYKNEKAKLYIPKELMSNMKRIKVPKFQNGSLSKLRKYNRETTYISPSVRSDLKRSFYNKLRAQSCIKDKITIAGDGDINALISAFLLQKRLTKDLVIMNTQSSVLTSNDINEFLHASVLLGSPNITTCIRDIDKTRNSKYVIITAEAVPKSGESQMRVIQRTSNILKYMVPKLVYASPLATYIVLSKPFDLMTYVTQKVGHLNRDNCFTPGCHLDTARFRYFISKRLDIKPNAVNGFIIGGHGKNSVPVWSSVFAKGIRLAGLQPDLGTKNDLENWNDIHTKASTDYNNGGTHRHMEWALAIATVDIVESIIKNNGRVVCLGTNVNGLNGINQDIIMSLPCVLAKEGISEIIEIPLTNLEQRKLLRCAEKQQEIQNSLKI